MTPEELERLKELCKDDEGSDYGFYNLAAEKAEHEEDGE